MTSWNNGNPDLLFGPLRSHNIERCNTCFHQCDLWSPTRWMLCVCGEVGELVNAVKKTWRGDGTPEQIGEEGADVLIYLDLYLHRTERGVLSSGVAPMYWRPRRDVVGEISDRDCVDAVFYAADLLLNAEGKPLLTKVASVIYRTSTIMQKAGLDPAAEIVRKFDKVSAKVGYTPRLADLAVPA